MSEDASDMESYEERPKVHQPAGLPTGLKIFSWLVGLAIVLFVVLMIATYIYYKFHKITYYVGYVTFPESVFSMGADETVASPNEIDCIDKCTHSDKCNFVYYDESGQVCHMGNTVNNIGHDTKYQSFIKKKGVPQPYVTVLGKKMVSDNLIPIAAATTHDTCKFECNADEDCIAFMFDNNLCNLSRDSITLADKSGTDVYLRSS